MSGARTARRRCTEGAGAAVLALLRAPGVDDVIVTVGGTIPNHDILELERLGVAAVFTPGAPLRDIIDFLQRSAGERTPA